MQVGAIYYHRSVVNLRFEFIRFTHDGDIAEVRVIGTHDDRNWPIGRVVEWCPADLVKEQAYISICSCYWSRHPLYCTCKE